MLSTLTYTLNFFFFIYKCHKIYTKKSKTIFYCPKDFTVKATFR